MAVAVMNTKDVHVIVLFSQKGPDVQVDIAVKRLPPGNHGLHIHKAGDLRQGCQSLCEHWSVLPSNHGGPPRTPWSEAHGPRHTGDLGNINHTTRKRLT